MRKGKTKWNNRKKSEKVPPRVYFSTSIESLHSLAQPSCCWALSANCGPQALRSQGLWQGHFLDARAMEPVGELQHGAVQNAFWSCILDKWCGAAVYQETKQSSSRVQLLIDQDFYISGYHWICLIFSGSLEEIGFPWLSNKSSKESVTRCCRTCECSWTWPWREYATSIAWGRSAALSQWVLIPVSRWFLFWVPRVEYIGNIVCIYSICI